MCCSLENEFRSHVDTCVPWDPAGMRNVGCRVAMSHCIWNVYSAQRNVRQKLTENKSLNPTKKRSLFYFMNVIKWKYLATHLRLPCPGSDI
jgi:hypothetical protein